MNQRTIRLALCGLLTTGVASETGSLNAQEATPPSVTATESPAKRSLETQSPASEKQSTQTMIDRCVEFLRVKGQDSNGAFSASAGVGPTGLVVHGLLAVGVPKSDPMVEKALRYLEQNVQSDGGIYAAGSKHQNYDTCIAMTALQAANDDERFGKVLKRAEAFVKQIQWDEGEGKEPSDSFYGGAGYGSSARPDLSNTAFLIDALHTVGRNGEDEAMKKALEFVSRCQNLESPHNSTEFAAKIDDGGFYYTVAGGGESKAGTTDVGGLRSYGSMTYAGLKSMIYAGVDQNDPRVKAAVTYLKKHYTLEENPGVGQQGLFYYYQTMAKALKAIDAKTFVDESGTEHDWRGELTSKLSKLQQADGSWTNPTTRWMEGDPNLVCGYVLLALSNCQ